MEDNKGNLMKYIFLLKNEPSIGVSEKLLSRVMFFFRDHVQTDFFLL
jgi:hypothetical protein